MIVAISARFEIAPEHLSDYLQAAATVIRETRKEPGCRLYAFSRDILEENVVWISEQWDSKEDLQRHFTTAHIRHFREFLTGVRFISRDVRKYSVTQVGGI